MTTTQLLLSGWQWDPFACVIGVAMVVGFGFLTRFRPTLSQAAWLALALAILTLALFSPLGMLARSYLFSAHMLQHLLLLLIAPAFLLRSLPGGRARLSQPAAPLTSPDPPNSDNIQVRPSPRFHFATAAITHPAIAWLAGVSAMWIWHAPTMCNVATTTPVGYRLQVVSLLVMGAMFWWPLLGPREERRLSPLVGVTYLFSACLACTVLGIYITFTPLTVCSIYAHPVDPRGILPLIQNRWGLTPSVDQHLGGLIMWVPACLIYLSGVIGMMIRWYSNQGEESTAEPTVSEQPIPRPNSPLLEHP